MDPNAYRRQYGRRGSVDDPQDHPSNEQDDLRPHSQPGRRPGAPIPGKGPVDDVGISWGREGRQMELDRAQKNAEWKADVQRQIDAKSRKPASATPPPAEQERARRPAPIPNAFTRPTSQERQAQVVRSLPDIPPAAQPQHYQPYDQVPPEQAIEKWLPRDAREANPQLQSLLEVPRSAEEVITKVTACGTALSYLAEESTRMRDDMEGRFRRMEQALVQETKAHTEQVMDSRRELQQVNDLARRLKQVEVVALNGEEKGEMVSGQTAAVMQEISRLDSRVEQLQQVGMQQATALNRDLSEFETELMTRVNIPEIAAVQAEMRARLTESQGELEQLRVLTQRQQEAISRQEDANAANERHMLVELEQRNAVTRQLIDDRVQAVQQRTEGEMKTMLRELSKIQDAASIKMKDGERSDERERGFSDRRLAELEQAVETERRARTGLHEQFEHKFEAQIHSLSKSIAEEQAAREERERVVAGNIRGTKEEVEAARIGFDDVVKAEVRARLQAIEQAEQKVEWLIKREDSVLRTARSELQSQVSTIESRMTKAEGFLTEQIDQVRAACTDMTRESSIRGAKAHSALEGQVTRTNTKLGSVSDKMDFMSRDLSGQIDTNSKLLREEIESCAKMSAAHLEAAVARQAGDTASLKHMLEQDIRPSLQEMKETNRMVSAAVESLGLRMVEQVGEVKMQCGRHRDSAREDALGVCSGLERKLLEVTQRNMAVQVLTKDHTDSIQGLERRMLDLSAAQNGTSTEARVNLEQRVSTLNEQAVDRTNAHLRQMRDMLTSKLESSEKSIIEQLGSIGALASGQASSNQSETMTRAEEGMKQKCRQDFASLRHSLASLSMSAWPDEDEESGGQQSVELAMNSMKLPMSSTKEEEMTQLRKQNETLNQQVENCLRNLPTEPTTRTVHHNHEREAEKHEIILDLGDLEDLLAFEESPDVDPVAEIVTKSVQMSEDATQDELDRAMIIASIKIQAQARGCMARTKSQMMRSEQLLELAGQAQELMSGGDSVQLGIESRPESSRTEVDEIQRRRMSKSMERKVYGGTMLQTAPSVVATPRTAASTPRGAVMQSTVPPTLEAVSPETMTPTPAAVPATVEQPAVEELVTVEEPAEAVEPAAVEETAAEEAAEEAAAVEELAATVEEPAVVEEPVTVAEEPTAAEEEPAAAVEEPAVVEEPVTVAEEPAAAEEEDPATSAFEAATANDNDTLKYLMEKKGVSASKQDSTGTSLLGVAALAGSYQVCESLIELKADVMQKNVDGNQPIHLAAINGHTDVIKQLLSTQADTATMLGTKNIKEQTALDIATEAKDNDAIVSLGGEPLIEEATKE